MKRIIPRTIPGVRICKRGHRYKDSRQCPICNKHNQQKWKLENKEKVIAHNKAYREKHRDELNAYTREWKAANPNYVKCHYWANPAKHRADVNRRKAMKLQRTPKWLTETHWQQIDIFYAAACALTIELGVQFDVDHIVPLRGKNVSGLHVPWNLQVLTKSDNCRKSNKCDV